MTSRYAVCLSVDARMLIPGLYVAHAVRTLSRSNEVDVIVVTGPDDADDTARAWMEQNGIIHCDDIDRSRLAGIRIEQERLSPATLVKLLLPTHFADRYEKILFLDADITIEDDVTAVFALDTGPHVLAAVPAGRIWDGASDSERTTALDHLRALGMSPPFRFFNSGVVLFDVAKWNRSEVLDRTFDFLRRNIELCYLPDEHALNATLDGDIAELSPIWNMRYRLHARTMIHDAARPVIIHHVGGNKPWKRFGREKRVFADLSAYRIYKAFLSHTPWPNWLGTQWTARDLRRSISWEYRRMSRNLRGKPEQMPFTELQAYADAFLRYCAEGAFADVEQGITVRENGRLRLKERGSAQ